MLHGWVQPQQYEFPKIVDFDENSEEWRKQPCKECTRHFTTAKECTRHYYSHKVHPSRTFARRIAEQTTDVKSIPGKYSMNTMAERKYIIHMKGF